jgi:hydroxymethylpyrimidine pyrophosphatase-like HAD family hydrolase
MHKIGLRNIKTATAVFITLFIYFLLYTIDTGFASLWYSPFFAGIAAAYAVQGDSSSSFKQARIRSFGSIIGGVYGVFVIYLYEAISRVSLEVSAIEPIYLLTLYVVVGVGVIPLIYVTVLMKQTSATFVAVLTYLSVTVSLRNNLAIEYFAVNRILSTIIGVIVALMVNKIHLNYIKNKDILFVCGLDGTLFVNNNELSGYTKHKLNHLIELGANITIATTRSPSTLYQTLSGVDFKLPMILMKGSAIYDVKTNHYIETNPIRKESSEEMSNYFISKNKNYFSYSIYEDVLTVFHNDFNNKAEKHYYDQHKTDQYKNFVKASLYDACHVLFFMLIDTYEEIQKMADEIKKINTNQDLDIKVFPFEDFKGYYFMRIYDFKSTKYDAINQLVEKNNYQMVVALGSKIFDLPMMQKADYSIALNSSPQAVKDTANIILTEDHPEAIVAQISKIFSMKHPKKHLKGIIMDNDKF